MAVPAVPRPIYGGFPGKGKVTMEERTIPRAEQAADRLQGLYRQYGYLPYKMSKFEEYDLYVRNKSFLNSPDILTFTDLDGKLMALKPDVTLSIAKNAQPAPGECKKYYYTEQVCRPSRESHTFAEISQMGLECIGAVRSAARLKNAPLNRAVPLPPENEAEGALYAAEDPEALLIGDEERSEFLEKLRGALFYPASAGRACRLFGQNLF